MTIRHLAIISLLCLPFGFSACALSEEDTGQAEQGVKQKIFCGGIASIQCPTGLECVDDPNDGCDPLSGGADCGGMCVRPSKKRCEHKPSEYVAYGEQCDYIRFFCGPGFEPFFDECGCGCERAEGEACNQTTCGAGEFCCNYSCSICAPLDGVCTQQFCM